jgi:hypothetical protein
LGITATGGMIMLDEIEKIDMPDWLQGDTFQFNLQNILLDSLYYPACGLDGIPVRYFMGNVYSFIYVDYGISEEDFKKKIAKKNAFRGYKIIFKESISKSQLVNGANNYSEQIDFSGFISDSPKESLRKRIQKPYCCWVIFERLKNYTDEHNPKRFSLLYLSSEGVSAYHALYVNNDIAPKILCIINPGHAFGYNWTNFTDRNKPLARTVFSMENNSPKYLINGGFKNIETIWPEYNKNMLQKLHRDSDNRETFFVVWGRR